MPRLENWKRCDTDHRSPNLEGNVYGHPRLVDGAYVWTSTLQSIDEAAGIAITRNTRYELGMRAALKEKNIETFIQPKITGYRQLNEQEADLMNRVKALGISLGELVGELRSYKELDQRWVSIGATDLQTGLMALTRAVAQPTTF